MFDSWGKWLRVIITFGALVAVVIYFPEIWKVMLEVVDAAIREWHKFKGK